MPGMCTMPWAISLTTVRSRLPSTRRTKSRRLMAKRTSTAMETAIGPTNRLEQLWREDKQQVLPERSRAIDEGRSKESGGWNGEDKGQNLQTLRMGQTMKTTRSKTKRSKKGKELNDPFAFHLLMITYNRNVDHQGKEDKEVERIVQSVTIEA
jgi:hypothetical protein